MKALIPVRYLVVGKVGWCLKYARDKFGIQSVYGTAAEARAHVKYWHPASEPLPNVPVFVHFDWIGNPDDHIAVYDPGKGIYSSPLHSYQLRVIKPTVQDLIDYFKQDSNVVLKYLGWSEDINNERVAQEIDEMIPDKDNYYWRYGKKLAMQIRGRELSRSEFSKHIAGQTSLRAIEILSDNPEATKAQAWQDLGKTATNEDWSGQITDLKVKLAATQKAVDTLTAQLSVQSGDTQLLNGFGKLLNQLLVRWGLKG